MASDGVSGRVPDLGALTLLLAVERTGSLNAAAAMVGTSQQAASARMRAMETQVGVPLLVRSNRGSMLTHSGRLVAQWAGAVLAAAHELEAGLSALRADRATSLRVAASLTIAEQVAPRWFAALRSRQQAAGGPVTDLRLRATNSDGVVGLVAAGDADIGFVEGPDPPAGLPSQVIGQDHLVVVVAPGHPWAGPGREVGAAELAASPLVSREPGSGTRETLRRALAAHLPRGAGLAAPAMELASAAAVRAAVVAGVAPGAMSALTIADDLGFGRLVAVRVPQVDLARDLRAVWAAGPRPPAGPARDLVALARADPTTGSPRSRGRTPPAPTSRGA